MGDTKQSAKSASPRETLVSVEDLSVDFHSGGKITHAVKQISFDVGKAETVALVGESGSGKTVTALSILRLLPYPAALHPSGVIHFKGEDLMALAPDALRHVRGNQISMIFQEPMTSLNPLHTIEQQIGEVLKIHRGLSNHAARERVLDLLDKVGIKEPKGRLDSYPHQLSGGQRQRVMIAMALANEPDLLIADEPTTALDVTIQAQILDVILDLQRKLGTAIILITHDLGVVAETAQRVIVMYAGRKVEEAPVEELFARPQHPYTRGLMASIPRLALMRGEMEDTGERLQEIPGMVPALSDLPKGCVFAPRCAYAQDRCRQAYPAYEEKRPRHWAACWRSEELFGGSDG